jgi:hypothetical protein
MAAIERLTSCSIEHMQQPRSQRAFGSDERARLKAMARGSFAIAEVVQCFRDEVQRGSGVVPLAEPTKFRERLPVQRQRFEWTAKRVLVQTCETGRQSVHGRTARPKHQVAGGR